MLLDFAVLRTLPSVFLLLCFWIPLSILVVGFNRGFSYGWKEFNSFPPFSHNKATHFCSLHASLPASCETHHSGVHQLKATIFVKAN